MFGTFTRVTLDYKQPNTKQLDLFIAQMISDGVKQSTLDILRGAYVSPFYRYPNEMELQNHNINTDCIVTVQHDQDTQALYEDDSNTKGKVLSQWTRPYVINTRIKNINEKTGLNQSEIIKEIRDELVDLFTQNQGEYSNTGSSTETFKNRPLHNDILEDVTIYEGSKQTPSHIVNSLTILFTIFK